MLGRATAHPLATFAHIANGLLPKMPTPALKRSSLVTKNLVMTLFMSAGWAP